MPVTSLTPWARSRIAPSPENPSMTNNVLASVQEIEAKLSRKAGGMVPDVRLLCQAVRRLLQENEAHQRDNDALAQENLVLAVRLQEAEKKLAPPAHQDWGRVDG